MPRTLGLYDDAAGEAPLTSTILPPSASDDDLESAAAATTDVGGAVYRQQQWHKRDRSTITLAVFLALGTIAGIITLVSTVSSNANLIAELEAALSAQKVETSKRYIYSNMIVPCRIQMLLYINDIYAPRRISYTRDPIAELALSC